MHVRPFLAKRKANMAPKSLLLAGELRQSRFLLSLVCRQLLPLAAKLLCVCSDIFVWLFGDGFVFVTRLLFFGEHTLKPLEGIMNLERPYSGEFGGLTFVRRP